MTSPSSPIMHEITVTINGVKKLLSKLNPYKTPGPDLVPSRFLKEFANEISPALTLLFNASLLQGIITTEWKEAFINPICKSGKNDRGNPENYQPISLTAVTCKILEPWPSKVTRPHILHFEGL